MIPKIIHYCWFGGNPLPEDAKKCIASWKKYLPDYEIIEWNESNFDVNAIQYTREAYEAKKYAFVSDYARFKILYEQGGIYFDTDVEVIRPMQHIIDAGPFMGIEKSTATNGHAVSGIVGVAPGLGIGASKEMDLYKEILDLYESLSYANETGTVVTHATNILRGHGFRNKNEKQQLAGITVYPADVFCPMDSTTGLIEVTPDSVSIHHYSCSWIDRNTLSFKLHLLKNKLIGIFGAKPIMLISKLFRFVKK